MKIVDYCELCTAIYCLHFWSFLLHSSQPVLIFSWVRIPHLERLKEVTWFHCYRFLVMKTLFVFLHCFFWHWCSRKIFQFSGLDFLPFSGPKIFWLSKSFVARNLLSKYVFWQQCSGWKGTEIEKIMWLLVLVFNQLLQSMFIS